MSKANQSDLVKVMFKASRYLSIYLFGIGLIVTLNVQYLQYHPQPINWFPYTSSTFAALIICIVGIEKLVSLWIEPPQFRQSKIPLFLRGCYYIPFLVVGFFMFVIGALEFIGPMIITEHGPTWATRFDEVVITAGMSFAGYLVLRESFIQLRVVLKEGRRRRSVKMTSNAV